MNTTVNERPVLHRSDFVGLAIGKIVDIVAADGTVLASAKYWYNYGPQGATFAYIR